MAGAIEARAEEITAAECRNTGKPVAMTRAEEVPPLADELRFFAGAARVLDGKSAGEYMRGCTSMTRREPVGVCAQVTPWNYPMMMAVWKFAPALAAGNTVVLKPSDTTPTAKRASLCAGADSMPIKSLAIQIRAFGLRRTQPFHRAARTGTTQRRDCNQSRVPG
jgi:betaine-aldehyde dehydrogenase